MLAVKKVLLALIQIDALGSQLQDWSGTLASIKKGSEQTVLEAIEVS